MLDDPDADVLVPVERRRTGVVFQDYLLFPHLSVLDNVAFGLRSRGVPRKEAAAAAHGWLERVGVADLARSRPGRISGGQAQRVALARALVTEPALLLLDEPLAALDAQTRLDVRSDLRRHLAGYDGCTVLVTHDPLDAMVLADRIVVVENGSAVQRGTPAEVARAPRTEYVARLVGLNLYRGRADGATVHVDGGGEVATASATTGEVFVAFAPSAVSLHARAAGGLAAQRVPWPRRRHGAARRHGAGAAGRRAGRAGRRDHGRRRRDGSGRRRRGLVRGEGDRGQHLPGVRCSPGRRAQVRSDGRSRYTCRCRP